MLKDYLAKLLARTAVGKSPEAKETRRIPAGKGARAFGRFISP